MGWRTDRNPRKGAVSADGRGRFRDATVNPLAGAASAYPRATRTYTVASAICNAAQGIASFAVPRNLHGPPVVQAIPSDSLNARQGIVSLVLETVMREKVLLAQGVTMHVFFWAPVSTTNTDSLWLLFPTHGQGLTGPGGGVTQL